METEAGGEKVRQEKLLDERNWDLLIILDACRYDYFKEIYPEYLEGNLKKAISPASNTGEWCQKVLNQGGLSDTTIFSSNPHINSLTPISSRAYSYDIRDNVNEIVDVWLSEWDEEKGVVLPEDLTHQVLNVDFDRAIVWYTQPHAPFLTCDLRESPGKSKEKRAKQPDGIGDEPLLVKLIRSGFVRLEKVFPFSLCRELYGLFRKVSCKTGMESLNPKLRPLRKTLYLKGQANLVNYYVYNLRRVLESIKILVKRVDREIVITADHGEGLGNEIVSHPVNSDARVLREVPWLEVDGVAR